MAHITLPEGIPGIIGPMMKYPEMAAPLNDLAQVLLRGPSPLTPGERELIAAYTSSRNECFFCTNSHSAAAKHLLDGNGELVEQVKADVGTAPVSDKMRALLTIAGKVQADACTVTEEDVAEARTHGAGDKEIHDTVLIAAAFCMFNRYVDGLATWSPDDPAMYDRHGASLAADGYGHLEKYVEDRPAATS